jgi:hypothetical protein
MMIFRNKSEKKIIIQRGASDITLEPNECVTVDDDFGFRIRGPYKHVLEVVEEEETSTTNLAAIHEIEVPKPILHVSQMQVPVIDIKKKPKKLK